MLLLLSACATINAVQPGPSSGEFYALVSRFPFRRGEVLWCSVTSSGGRGETRCVRALTSDQASELGPDGEPVAAWAFTSDVDGPAAAQSTAERAALTVPATTGEVPASARLLARQLYEATGRTVPADLAADAAAVWARIQAGTDLQAVREAATKGAPLVPAGADLDAILTAGGLPGTAR